MAIGIQMSSIIPQNFTSSSLVAVSPSPKVAGSLMQASANQNITKREIKMSITFTI
jgi:hypothetical protein